MLLHGYCNDRRTGVSVSFLGIEVLFFPFRICLHSSLSERIFNGFPLSRFQLLTDEGWFAYVAMISYTVTGPWEFACPIRPICQVRPSTSPGPGECASAAGEGYCCHGHCGRSPLGCEVLG